MSTTTLQAPKLQATTDEVPAPASSDGGPPTNDVEAVRDLVRDFLDSSSEADPSTAADALVGHLTPPQLRVAALYGLKAIARDTVRANTHRRDNERSGGSSRWDNVADAEKEHRDVMMERICIVKGNQSVGSVWKFLGECTAADLASAEALKRDQAAGAIASVKAYQRLRAELKTPGQKVKSLNATTVREILHA